MTEPSICPDCGRNSEFMLHEEGCPAFGREVDQFIEQHEAEVASWPDGPRQALESLNAMQSCLFGKWMRAHLLLTKLSALPSIPTELAEQIRQVIGT